MILDYFRQSGGLERGQGKQGQLKYKESFNFLYDSRTGSGKLLKMQKVI